MKGKIITLFNILSNALSFSFALNICFRYIHGMYEIYLVTYLFGYFQSGYHKGISETVICINGMIEFCSQF